MGLHIWRLADYRREARVALARGLSRPVISQTLAFVVACMTFVVKDYKKSGDTWKTGLMTGTLI